VNVVVNVYDVAPDGRATMITRGAALAPLGAWDVRLFPTDWTFAAGHRVGVLVSGANSEAYVHVPSRKSVSLSGGSVSLPWMSAAARTPTQGTSNPRLEVFKEAAPFEVDTALIAARTDPRFPLPRR